VINNQFADAGTTVRSDKKGFQFPGRQRYCQPVPGRAAGLEATAGRSLSACRPTTRTRNLVLLLFTPADVPLDPGDERRSSSVN